MYQLRLTAVDIRVSPLEDVTCPGTVFGSRLPVS